MSKIISADAAARLINDGEVVTVSSSSGLGCPDKVLAALGARFAAEGHPRDLTMLHPIAAGDMYGIRGIDHIALPQPWVVRADGHVSVVPELSDHDAYWVEVEPPGC